jgi:hypothetical protein
VRKLASLPVANKQTKSCESTEYTYVVSFQILRKECSEWINRQIERIRIPQTQTGEEDQALQLRWPIRDEDQIRHLLPEAIQLLLAGYGLVHVVS